MMRLPAKRCFQLGQPAGERRLRGDPRGHPVQRVDHRVAGDVDAGRIDVLGPERCRRDFGRGEMQAGHGADDLAVNLLGPGVIDIARAQPRLDVIDRQLAVIGGERAAHGGGGIALDHDPRRPRLVHHRAQPGEQPRGQRVEALVGLHHVEIVVRHDPGDIEHLVEHAAMLRGNADLAVEPRVGLERGDHREQLDGFRPGAEDDEDGGGGSHGKALSRGGLRVDKVERGRSEWKMTRQGGTLQSCIQS